MQHVPTLIGDLALILVLAGGFTLLFRRLHQPLVLGYILAGLLAGPNLHFLPAVADMGSIKTWADIGVIFLLFSLGLEFSLKQLIQVGGTAVFTGLFEISCMVASGFGVGRLLGWPVMDCVFLGGILAISSTTIIIRSFEELQVKSRKFASLVTGLLVVEDVLAVLMLVLLSTLAISRHFSGQQLASSSLKLLFFLILWFVSGIYVLPSFLKRTRHLMSDEILLMVSLGLCLLMVVLASAAGFSAPLGAFIMGSILSETIQGPRIVKLIHSVKDLFAAVFFISVGMLINLPLLYQQWLPILLLTAVLIAGKTLFVSGGALMAGQPLKQSLQTGMSMTQIGEFSFIIATLGMDLKVTSSSLYSIAVGVSVLSTFTTPYLIRGSDAAYGSLERWLPAGWVDRLNRYGKSARSLPASSAWKTLLKTYMRLILVNGVFCLAILLLSIRYMSPWLASQVSHPILRSILGFLMTLMLMAPFIWALSLKRLDPVSFRKLWVDRSFNRGPLVLLEISRRLLGIFLIAFLLDHEFSAPVAIASFMALGILLLVLFSRRLQQFYRRLEQRFMENLHGHANPPESDPIREDMIPWDGHLAYFTLDSEASCIGYSLQELHWREQFGINVAMIQRGRRTILTPGRDERIYPEDRLGVIGTDVQLDAFQRHLQDHSRTPEIADQPAQVQLLEYTVGRRSPLNGKSLQDSGIRYSAKGLVVGVERAGRRWLNPDSQFVFQEGDLVWLVGNKQLLQEFL